MTRTLELKYISGLSLSVEVVLRGTNIIAETIVLTEKTVAKTHYTGVITSGAGDYDLALKVGANYVGTDEVRIEATDAVTYYARSCVNVDQLRGDEQSARDLKDFADEGYDPVTNLVNTATFTIDVTTGNKIADYVLRRKLASARASVNGDSIDDGRSLIGMASKHVNKFAPEPPPNENILTIYQENDTTPFWTQTIVTDITAEPIISADTN